MANVLVEESSLSAIADSIRAKNGTATTYKPAEMSGAIDALPTGGGTMQSKSVSYTPTESAQSGTVTPDVGYDGLSSVSVSVGAIDDEYVGSAVTRRSVADLDITGATFTAPEGYYSSDADITMMTGHMSVSATKGTVSNHSVSVTPKAAVDNAGYFATGDRTGTAVSVSASELVSGSETKTQNGTYDVTNLAELVVNVSGQAPTGTKNISITQNGTTTEDVTAYANAQITANVPNSYSASDEGKVVDNGALVSQTSDSVTVNGTVDTTLINSLTVNVSGGGVTKSITNILGDSTTLVTGYFNSTGTSISAQGSTAKEVTTDYIDIHEYAGSNIVMWQKIASRIAPWVTAVFYNSSKSKTTSRVVVCEPLSSNSAFKSASSVEYDATTGNSLASSTVYTIPSGSYYVRFSFRTGGNAQICATTDTTSLGYWSHDISEIVFVDAIESDGTAT